jgi:hypothetical protein
MADTEKDELAKKKKKTSRKYLDLNYIKILPNTQTQIQTEMATVAIFKAPSPQRGPNSSPHHEGAAPPPSTRGRPSQNQGPVPARNLG